jgi:gliding motility-associated-like protein
VCNGDANGTINIVAGGGVAPYQYALSPFTTYQSSGTFTGLTANTYVFEVKDNVGCTKQITVVLTEPLLLTASAVSTSGSCNGNDGTITITAGGGTPAYEYSVDNGVTYQAANNFVVSGGAYPDIRVRDSKGCIANAATNVILIDTMYIKLGPDSVICEGQSVRFEVSTNPQTDIFKWRTIPDPIRVNTLDYDSIKNATATPSDTTTYILNAKWGVCPAREDTITVLVKRRPIPDAGPTAYVCYDNKVTTLNGSASHLSGTVNYEWTDTTHLETPHTNVTVARPDTTEDFILTVTDNYGCNFIEKDTVRVYVQPPVPAFAGNDTIAIRGTPHQLLATGGVNYEWTPSTPLNLSTIANPLATLFNDQQFVVKVTDIGGCIGFDTVYVQIYDGPAYYVPNTFSPNGDGINDIFRAIPVGISYTEWFRVFNRFGELVFETNKWLKGWDGTYLGKKQSPGVYVS